jgi:hypothetical protein
MLAISRQVHLRPLGRARNSTPSPRNLHLYESIRLETRIKIARLDSLILFGHLDGPRSFFLVSLFYLEMPTTVPGRQTMSCVRLGCIAWNGDYDYAGMELEHLEDIPGGSGIGSLG